MVYLLQILTDSDCRKRTEKQHIQFLQFFNIFLLKLLIEYLVSFNKGNYFSIKIPKIHFYYHLSENQVLHRFLSSDGSLRRYPF